MEQVQHDLVMNLIESTNPYPVDFDEAWQWVGYNKKQQAKEKLIRNFQRDMDFTLESVKTPNGGRPSESIALTVDCFKSFCMMAGTDKGKEVRAYFIKCEKELKNGHRPKTNAEALLEMVQEMVQELA